MPYDSSNFDFYRQERMLPFIDLIRDTPKLGRSRLGVLTSVRNGMDQLLPIAGMVFLFGVLGYALISGMVS